MKLWIARDRDGSLYIYSKKPKKIKIEGIFILDQNSYYFDYFKINNNKFREVTFENSPQQVEINLIKNEKV